MFTTNCARYVHFHFIFLKDKFVADIYDQDELWHSGTDKDHPLKS